MPTMAAAVDGRRHSAGSDCRGPTAIDRCIISIIAFPLGRNLLLRCRGVLGYCNGAAADNCAGRSKE